MKHKIKLGYEVPEGKEVFIEPSHLIVTGITQLSGKTTTLEALIRRSKLKAIVFITKRGEKSFEQGTTIRPFFRDRSDYEFVRSLIETYSREKLNIEKGQLMNLCKGSRNLVDIKKRVDEGLSTGKLRGIKEEIFTRLQHYLEMLIPQIERANFSTTLPIREGINIMDLEGFSEEAQSLIISAVADEVLKTTHGVVIVIPEAWKFIPQKYNNPCKRAVESFIRQGATNRNYIWIDSQDMAGVDKVALKQISTWILGYQSERNEVKHTLDQISGSAKSKPPVEEIMSLKVGQFYLSTREKVVKVYVQPLWAGDGVAKDVAMGKTSAPVQKSWAAAQDEVFKKRVAYQEGKDTDLYQQMKEELQLMRLDFFNKIVEIFKAVDALKQRVYSLQHSAGVDETELMGKILQKLPISALANPGTGTVPDIDEIVQLVMSRLPTGQFSGNGTVYQVAPLEKIKRDFLVQAKNKIVADINSLSEDAKRMLLYIETKQKGVKTAELVAQCFLMKEGGYQRDKVGNAAKELISIGVLRKDSAGWHYSELKPRISQLIGNHNATDSEINETYNHILNEIIK